MNLKNNISFKNNQNGGDNNNNKMLNLTENGRIFPLWVMLNFKKYYLPEIIRKEGEDPCKETLSNELTKYQQFVGDFLNYTSPFKDILVYHGLGSGKTVTAINVYNILYNYTPKWNIFLIIPAALKNDPWLKDIKNWLQKENYEDRLKNITFVHYDSPYADRDFLEKIKKVDSSKPFLFIIDEAHRFITNVYNNVSSKKGKRAQVIYDYIQQEKRENNNNRIMLLSATPAVNTPFELALIFNLLRPDTFPTSESIFSQIYISSSNFASLNENNKNMFQRRILGLVSYYLGATPDKFATKIIHYKNIIMSKYQEEIYNYFEEIEEAKEKMLRRLSRGKIGDDMSTYNSYTRQACNFVFPNIDDIVNGEQRPRPGKFRINDVEAIVIDEGKDEEKKRNLIKKNKELGEYVKAIKNYINKLIEYFKNLHREDKIKNHTIDDDIKNFKEKYNNKFSLFLEKEKNKSSLFNKLYDCSPKMITIIFNILKSKGPVLFYSNYVEMEGLQIFKIYLQFFGYINVDNDSDFNIANYDENVKEKNFKNDYFRFVEYHGSIDKEQRDLNKIIFNNKANKYGKLAKIIMISPAGSEGINLYNVRQVHILEPYWNEVRIEQVIGRAIRICHHVDLPMDERKVDVFRYKMIRKNGKETSDEKLENISRKKNNLLLSFIEAIKEAAVDCELFKQHNMMGTKYKCFQFNEESFFEENIGPAYNEKIDYDQKINNGLNSKDSKIMKIKVRKIKAVKKISDNLYSDTNFYWYYKKSGVVYDFELNFPVGKIKYDDLGNEMKINGDTYIIDNLINIPTFKLY
jgi:superfamily II DNA or RNA helicase